MIRRKRLDFNSSIDYLLGSSPGPRLGRMEKQKKIEIVKGIAADLTNLEKFVLAVEVLLVTYFILAKLGILPFF